MPPQSLGIKIMSFITMGGVGRTSAANFSRSTLYSVPMIPNAIRGETKAQMTFADSLLARDVKWDLEAAPGEAGHLRTVK